jgi:two-component system response regulator DegU
METAPTRIVIVDDSRSFRQAICNVLQKKPGLMVVAEAEDGHAGIQAVEKHNPDIVLMDISMPTLNGIDATRVIMNKFPATKVIVLTTHADETISDLARTAGACQFLAKDCLNKEKLLGAIEHSLAL